MKIKEVFGREIIDSRGQPTLECVLRLSDDVVISASVPSGASVGKYEAMELRDGDQKRFFGRGVLQAIKNLEEKIATLLIGKTPDVLSMDQEMIGLDGTLDKSNLGANTILAASIAVARAQARVHGVELYEFINKFLYEEEKPAMPLCMFNLINGGLHGRSGLCFQEFMVMPQAEKFRDNIEVACWVNHCLKKILAENRFSTAVGDEGGFAPSFSQSGMRKEKEALRLLGEAVGCSPFSSSEVKFCLDVAASCFYDDKKQKYMVYKEMLPAGELIDFYESLIKEFPIFSIEDGLGEDDWDGWKDLTTRLGGQIQLVGDDLFVTSMGRIQKGIDGEIANSVLIKPNQIGTVSETLEAIKLCKKAGYKVVISHRSGETNDSFIADLAVGAAADQLKAGAPVRGERVAKYNRLLAIEEMLIR